MESKYQMRTVEFGKFGVESAGQAYILLTKLFPEISNKELAKQHIFRICNSYDKGIPFDLGENKRSFAIGGFGAPTYVSIVETDQIEQEHAKALSMVREELKDDSLVSVENGTDYHGNSYFKVWIWSKDGNSIKSSESGKTLTAAVKRAIITAVEKEETIPVKN